MSTASASATTVRAPFLRLPCLCPIIDWLGRQRPCLTYGLRGVSYYCIEVEGAARDLHSGVYGGTVHEPMTDLIHVMASLVDPRGKILIPGVCDAVAPVTGTRLISVAVR